MATTEPMLTAALDQLGAMLEQHAKEIAVYYQTLIRGGIPVDTAADLAAALAKDLRKMAFHPG